MSLFPFKFKKTKKSFLGIDIGTSTIRVVELSRQKEAIQLDNYGEIKTDFLSKNTFLSSSQFLGAALKVILKEADIKTQTVNFSIPDFSSFFTNFELPPMPQEELEQAVRYEARSYIPLPLSEVTLDWQIIGERKILVVAIPNSVISQYQQIASFAGLKIKALEAEVFALARSLTQREENPLAVVDIGARSTTCSVFEKGILKISHSFNISGNEFTETLRKSLKIDYQKAEELKKGLGIIGHEGKEREIREILLPLIDTIIFEVKKTFESFRFQEGKDVQKIILAGESALMLGLKEYFFEELNKAVEIANPFTDLVFPPILGETLKEMGSAYAIAVGLALKELKQ